MNLGNLWRNEIVRKFRIMPEDEFSNLKCTFSAQYDPSTKQKLHKTFNNANFKQIFGGDETSALDHNNELFKLAAKSEIDSLQSPSDKIQLSTKYQVLCDQTAFIGIIKLKNKSENEIEKIEIKTASF